MHIQRIAAVLVAFGAAWVVLAYFLGYYDISFIDREAVFGSQVKDTDIGKDTESSLSSDESRSPDEDSSSALTESESVLSVHDTASLADCLKDHTFVSEADGYTITDKVYNASDMILAKMRFNFKLPSVFSLRQREVEQVEYVIKEQYGEYKAEYITVEADRPAVELYMGSIFIDNGTDLFLIDADGTPLCSFDDAVYKPAQTRDRSGRPLFFKEDEHGRKIYYYLSDDGKTFIGSDYNDIVDSRGLYFDYPAYWGLSDNAISREYNKTSKSWDYRNEYSRFTYQDFTDAFDFSEGIACVASDYNRGGMYFINEYGSRTHETFKTFLSDLNRYSIWDYAMPASRGIESLGFFYYDHGLTRVRYQVIDYYNWESLGNVRVVSDEDKLIRRDGTIFPLPVGYTLKAYSDGMILLERDGRVGFMDYTGGWIAEPVFASATPFVSGLAVLETEDGRFGMIDTEGNIILPFTYDYISQPSSGLISAYREENGWTVFKVMEKNEE
ncbi:MAG: WG repeat-containing protein [Ruminococcaceae bacterium]|nr:WG repeat-containing protein [Oscillospiraceae bacterium]